MGSDPNFGRGKMGRNPHSPNQYPHIPPGQPADWFITHSILTPHTKVVSCHFKSTPAAVSIWTVVQKGELHCLTGWPLSSGGCPACSCAQMEERTNMLLLGLLQRGTTG
ncbi:hypothetical protein Q8A73_009701 [Channa argus]|nr:hypothetical protein Q8A73_009701 [Channa argus]